MEFFFGGGEGSDWDATKSVCRGARTRAVVLSWGSILSLSGPGLAVLVGLRSIVLVPQAGTGDTGDRPAENGMGRYGTRE